MHLLSPVDFPGAIEPPFGHREGRKKRVKRHAPCACGGESESRRRRGGIGLGSAGPAMRSAHRATPSQPGHSEAATLRRSAEHTSELQSLMRISYAVFCLKTQNKATAIQPNICSTPHH